MLLKTKKPYKHFQTEVFSHISYIITFISEPLLEALPQVYILMYFYGVLYRTCKEQNDTKSRLCLGHILDGDNNLFFLTLMSSVFSAAFGITKFLKLGPCRFLPSKGFLGGYFTCSFALVMINVIINITGPPILLFGLEFLAWVMDIVIRSHHIFTLYFPMMCLKILCVSNPYQVLNFSYICTFIFLLYDSSPYCYFYSQLDLRIQQSLFTIILVYYSCPFSLSGPLDQLP